MIIARYPGPWKAYGKNFGKFFGDIKALMDKGKLRCPACGGALYIHSYYERSVIGAAGENGKIIIMRVVCREIRCGKTQAILPDFLMPYKRYTAEVIETSFKSVEADVSVDKCEAAAETSTINRWRGYLGRGILIAINVLQGILIEKGRKVGVMAFSGKSSLECLSILVKKFLGVENIACIIGGANAILTSYGRGYI